MNTVSFSEYRQDFPTNTRIIDIAGNDVTNIIKTYENHFGVIEDVNMNDDPNKCSVCTKFIRQKTEKISTHKKCEKIMRKITKLKNDLINCEFILYCLRN